MHDSRENDGELLRRWLDHGGEAPFRTLVERYRGLVHQSALRVCGNAAIAADASQLTFVLLARKARGLSSRSSLAGWLHHAACLQTRNLVRRQCREERKRQTLDAMSSHPHDTPEEAWREMAPVLDEALAALPESDREAILLRFYRSLSFAEIASVIGIATEAARKRVDRAVERLRRQLDNRGCRLSPVACLGALGQLGTDAQAAGALPVATLTAHAMQTTAGTTLIPTALAIIMTKKATIATAAALLIAGAGAVVLIQRDQPENGRAAAEETSGTPPRRTPALTATGDGPAGANRARTRGPSADQALVSNYGESRTNLSRHVVGNFIGLLEDAVSMGEMALSPEFSGAFGGRHAAFRGALGPLFNNLKLDDEQQTRASELYAEFQKRELERTKGSIEELKKNPSPLMEMMLASDAFARGEIDETEHKRIQENLGGDLAGIINPLDRNNFRGGQPLADESFVNGFREILDPGQQATLQTTLDERADTPQGPSGIETLPAMELEKLDQAVASGKKLTGGLKQMMEGMGSLQELGPLMKQQRENDGN